MEPQGGQTGTVIFFGKRHGFGHSTSMIKSRFHACTLIEDVDDHIPSNLWCLYAVQYGCPEDAEPFLRYAILHLARTHVCHIHYHSRMSDFLVLWAPRSISV